MGDNYVNRLKNHLSYSWHIYLLLGVLIVLVWSFAFSILGEPKYNEKIEIFIGVDSVQDEGLEEYLTSKTKDALNLKLISIDNFDPSDKYYSMVFNTRGINVSDILILSDNDVSDGKVEKFASPIGEKTISYITNNKEFDLLIVNGVVYGIKIFDPKDESKKYFENYIQYIPNKDKEDTEKHQSFWLIFNGISKNTANIDGVNKDDSWGNAIVFAKNILE